MGYKQVTIAEQTNEDETINEENDQTYMELLKERERSKQSKRNNYDSRINNLKEQINGIDIDQYIYQRQRNE